MNFVEQGDQGQGRKGSEGDTHERSDTVNSHSHTHDSATHRYIHDTMYSLPSQSCNIGF